MFGAVAFLTTLGRAAEPDARTVRWFPAVGALIGACLGGAWWAAGELWPPLLAAAVVIALDLALTGMLHFDGLVDTADGLIPHLPRDRRLAVMAEPNVGAFGIGAGTAVLLARVAALAALDPDVFLLAGAWCAARTMMAAAVSWLPYARPGGLVSSFAGGSRRWTVAYGAVLALVLAGSSGGVQPVSAVVAGALGGGAVLSAAHRRLNGYTGDVLGAAGMIVETVALLVMAARW